MLLVHCLTVGHIRLMINGIIDHDKANLVWSYHDNWFPMGLFPMSCDGSPANLYLFLLLSIASLVVSIVLIVSW